MNIGIDIMGGDYAPIEAMKGVAQYLQSGNPSVHLTLIGDEQKIKPFLEEFQIPSERVSIVHAPDVIAMEEHPTRAFREKTGSSIVIGYHLLASGKTDAFISAGNTGAMLIGAVYAVKAIEGVIRPTIPTLIPKENNAMGLLLDVGMNADCKAEHLNQFAELGALYAEHILGIDRPRVGLVNIGEEKEKGNLLTKATYPVLETNPNLNFVGNIEGRDIFKDKADVMVCDGFTGNIILKMAESFYEVTQKKGISHPYLDLFNFEDYGGTPVLGVSKPIIIGHGISHAKAFVNMIKLAEQIYSSNLLHIVASKFSGKNQG